MSILIAALDERHKGYEGHKGYVYIEPVASPCRRLAGRSANRDLQIDVLGSDKHELYLKYYADDETRKLWRTDYPEDPIPARETPPCDRDRHLPGNSL